jgi:ketosteroid isomerase-like protein
MHPEPIEPANADKPAEALRLVCEALSDGDLEAAVALYEPGATLALAAWTTARRTNEVRAALGELMETRLPVRVSVRKEIITGDLALVFAVRGMSGRSIDGSLVRLMGEGGAVLRKSAPHGWLLVVDDWNLTTGNVAGD